MLGDDEKFESSENLEIQAEAVLDFDSVAASVMHHVRLNVRV